MMADLMIEEEESEELNMTQMSIYESSNTISERRQEEEQLSVCVCVCVWCAHARTCVLEEEGLIISVLCI